MKRPGGFDKRVEEQPEPQKRGRGRNPQQAPGEAPASPRVSPSAPAPAAAATGPAVPAAWVPRGSDGPADDSSETVELTELGELTELSELRSPAEGAELGSGKLGHGRETVRDSGVELDESETPGSRGAVARVLRTSLQRSQREVATVDPVRAAEKRLREAERQSKRRTRRETRRFTAASRRTRRRLFVALGAVGALALFVIAGAFTSIMSVREIRVEGAQTVNAEELSTALAEFQGVPLALVDENAVLRALAGFPLIQRFAVERVPPETLVVRIEERLPSIAIEGDGVFRTYDAAGVLVSEAAERAEGVPLGVAGAANPTSKGFRAAAEVVRDMPGALRAQLSSVSAQSGQDVTFVLTSGVEVFWGSPEETRRKSLVLETMLAALEGREVSHIDVSSTDAPIFR